MTEINLNIEKGMIISLTIVIEKVATGKNENDRPSIAMKVG